MRAGIQAEGFFEWRRRFRLSRGRSEKLLRRALSNAAELVLLRAKTYYLTGGALRVRTGRLRSSVTKRPPTDCFKQGNRYWVEVGTNVWYGAAWELGFTVPPHEIRPRRRKALRFEVDGRVVFAKRVFIPGRTEKPRKWLEPAIRDQMPAIITLLEAAGVSWL